MPQDALLDPQGKTVENNTPKVGIDNISDIRIGKHITLEIKASNESEAKQKVALACEKLLANKIMESYTFSIVKI